MLCLYLMFHNKEIINFNKYTPASIVLWLTSLFLKMRSPCGLAAVVLDCNIVVSKFKLK